MKKTLPNIAPNLKVTGSNRRVFVVDCRHCRAQFERSIEVGNPCPSCGEPVGTTRRWAAPYLGGELIGAYGNGPKDAPWPEIKEGPNKGMNIVPSRKALFSHWKSQGVDWK